MNFTRSCCWTAMIGLVAGCQSINGIQGPEDGNILILGNPIDDSAILIGSISEEPLIASQINEQAEHITESDFSGAKVVRAGAGVTITYSDILFSRGSASLSSQTKRHLDSLTTVFKKYSRTPLTVEGHSDDRGSAARNMRLSKRRAQAVANYLINHGIQSTRLSAIGYGESKPVYNNKISGGRERNRRAEIVIRSDKTVGEMAKKRDGQ